MLSILDPVLDRHPLSKGRTLMSALAALLLVVPLAALHPYQRAAAARPTKDARAAHQADSANTLERALNPLVATFNSKAAQLATATAVLGAKLNGQSPNCDTIRFGSRSSTSTHIHSDDNGGGSSIIDYTKYNGEKCSSATIIGRLTYTETEDDVASMLFGAHAMFRERFASGDDRELTVSRADNGGIVHSYRRNGSSAPYDDEARRWFGGFLPTVLMEAGINVGPRVALWRAQGGADFVLSRIGTMSSSGSKRSHYEALIEAERLSNGDLDRIVRHAGRNLSSSGDLRSVLLKAAPTRGGGIRSGSALEDAIVNMASSGDKTAVLEAYGQTTDKEMLMSVMRVARTIQSSGDKARLLQELAQRYLSGNDRDLYSAYYQTALTIPSSGDLRNTLEMAIPYAAQSAEQTLLLIDATKSIASSGDRSNVLISLVQTGAVKTKEARDAFFAVTASVPSDGDRSRVLQAAVRP